MVTVTHKLITALEFSKMPQPDDGSKQELVRGEIITMPPPGFQHGVIQSRIARVLGDYVEAKRLGRITVESGLITERDPDSVRGPDVAYWSAERLPLDQVPEGYPEVAADLTVEVTSPSDLHHQVQAKVLEYLSHGVQMVWIVDPETRTVTVYRSRQEVRILQESDTLTGEDVLPDFSCAVAELFAVR